MKLQSETIITAALQAIFLVNHCDINAQEEKSKKPNIVFVLADQWRAQATSYNKDPNLKGKTPNLDSLAKQGINFTNTVSVCPVCTPYRASLLTGQYPTTTGMFFNDIQLPEQALTMAEIFKSSGYLTAYIGKWHLDGMGRFNFTPPERRQGFDYWKALECSHDYNQLLYYEGDSDEKKYWEKYGPYAETEDAISYIRKNADNVRPFLLFLAWGAPHFPHHTAPEELQDIFKNSEIKLPPNVPENMAEQAKKELIGYYAHILALDKCIGDLQEALNESGISENTIFVFTSDHGEMMGSQGTRPKLEQLPYAESVKVPFLMKYPQKFGNKKITVKSPLNTPDILPTLLSLAGIPVPETIEGESMADIIGKKSVKNEKAALIMNVSPFDNKANDEYRGIYTQRYTYIKTLNGPWLLYDNIKDPYQMNNQVNNPEFKNVRDQLETSLMAELRKINDDFKPREFYIKKWNYKLNEGGNIGYSESSPPQGPALNKK